MTSNKLLESRKSRAYGKREKDRMKTVSDMSNKKTPWCSHDGLHQGALRKQQTNGKRDGKIPFPAPRYHLKFRNAK